MSTPRASRALLRLLHAAAEPAYLLDGQGRIVYANPACAALVGGDVAGLLGQTCRWHSSPDVPPGDAVAAALCPPPELLAGQAGEAVIALAAGDGRWVRRRGWFVPLGGDEGRPRALLAVLAAQDLPAEAQSPADDDSPAALHQRLARLRAALAGRFALDRLVGTSPALRRVRAQVELAATSTASVLVVGPPGSGRQHIARSIHYAAPGAKGALVPLACGALAGELLRSTLGALLGAPGDSAAGATRTTLVLGDADRLPADLRAELAAHLDHPPATLRIVATAREPLVRLADRGEYRADLAAALSTLTIELPPLRERLEDLPLLAQRLLEDENARGEKQLHGWSAEALDRLAAYPWPGDAAELAEFARQAHAAAAGPHITPADLPERVPLAADAAARAPREDEAIDLEKLLAGIETRLIQQAIARARGNKTRAAELLGLNRPRLYRRLEQLGLA